MSKGIREEDIRTAALFGSDALEKLKKARVAVFGTGGVGGYICESLARVGVGSLDIIDGDRVTLSNINRQIVALHSTVGEPKVEVMKKRILDINPDCRINAHFAFYKPDGDELIDFSDFDYIADAIDDVPAKIALAVRAKREGVRIISAMGAGNKLDPSLFRVADLAKTEVCPLAKVMRKKLREYGITHMKVVFSPEVPRKNDLGVVGSSPFTPSVAGMIIASEIVKDLIGS